MVRFPAWFKIQSYDSFLTNICLQKHKNYVYKKKTFKKIEHLIHRSIVSR